MNPESFYAVHLDDQAHWHSMLDRILSSELDETVSKHLSTIAEALAWFADPSNFDTCSHFFTDGDLQDGKGEEVLDFLHGNHFNGKTIFLTDREPIGNAYFDIHFKKGNLIMARHEFADKIMSL